MSFPSNHPSFPGHFPGRPIVPGVLLLDKAQREIESRSGLMVTGIAAAKFLSPALPSEGLLLTYDTIGSEVRFAIHCGERKIASGRFLVNAGVVA